MRLTGGPLEWWLRGLAFTAHLLVPLHYSRLHVPALCPRFHTWSVCMCVSVLLSFPLSDHKHTNIPNDVFINSNIILLSHVELCLNVR